MLVAKDDRGENEVKTVPKYIRRKIERMSALMEQIVELNIDVELWVEDNSDVYDAFWMSEDNRDVRGYGITDIDGYVRAIEDAINGRGVVE